MTAEQASPKVAVVTRTLDRPGFLERAIRSVLAQTCDDWIHVVVNDGGDPGVVESALALHRPAYRGRLEVIHNGTSMGMEAASNIGIRASDSSYILIHDDDDSLAPTFLESTVAILDNPRHPDVAGVATLVNRIDEALVGDGIRQLAIAPYRSLGDCLSMGEVAEVNPCPPISFLFRRAVLEEIGMFDESLPVLGDWDFIARFISRYDIQVLQEPLANYHLRPSVASGAGSNTIHGQSDKHRYYDAVVRNRYARSDAYQPMGLLMQLHGRFGGSRAQLARLYRHPVLGRLIRAWSVLVNPKITASSE